MSNGSIESFTGKLDTTFSGMIKLKVTEAQINKSFMPMNLNRAFEAGKFESLYEITLRIKYNDQTIRSCSKGFLTDLHSN